MNYMLEMAQMKQPDLYAEAEARQLVKLAKVGQQPRRSRPTLNIGRILQMVLVMLK